MFDDLRLRIITQVPQVPPSGQLQRLKPQAELYGIIANYNRSAGYDWDGFFLGSSKHTLW